MKPTKEQTEVRFAVCKLCHQIRSLVEEMTKQPYGDGWVHRDCSKLAIIRGRLI